MSSPTATKPSTKCDNRSIEAGDEEKRNPDGRSQDEQDQHEYPISDDTERPPQMSETHTSQGISHTDRAFDCVSEDDEAELAAALERQHLRDAKARESDDKKTVASSSDYQLDHDTDAEDIAESWHDMHEDLRMLAAMGLKAREAREVDGEFGTRRTEVRCLND